MALSEKNSAQLVQAVYDRLETAIIYGEFKPRQRLIERQLEEQLNISRTPIREALRRLEDAGLVVNRPNRGAVVTDLNPHEIEDNYILRLSLQDLAITLMRTLTRSELASLRRMVADLKRAHADGDFRGWMKINKLYHEALMAAVDNATLLAELDRITAKTYAIWRVYALEFWSDPSGPRNSNREHEELLDAIQLEDWKRMRLLVIEHTMRPVRSYFQRVRLESGSDSKSPAGDRLERLVALLAKRNDRLPALRAAR